MKLPGAGPRTTLMLALLGLCFGSAFLPAPYSKSYFLRTLGGSLSTTLLVLGFAFLIHFLLLFRSAEPCSTNRGFQYYGLLLGLIPITFALAAVKKVGSAA